MTDCDVESQINPPHPIPSQVAFGAYFISATETQTGPHPQLKTTVVDLLYMWGCGHLMDILSCSSRAGLLRDKRSTLVPVRAGVVCDLLKSNR